MANDDEFDPKKVLPVEGLSKSEFQRWLLDQDTLVIKFVKLLISLRKL